MQRMIDSEVIRSDDFIELSHSAQALYFQLVMEADNFGFVKGIKRIIMSIGATDNALAELEKSRFVLRFDNGVFVLRHWMIANGHFKNDRAYPSSYPRELAKIILLEDLTYEICLDSSRIPDGFQVDSKRIPSKSNTISNPRQRHIINIINKAISQISSSSSKSSACAREGRQDDDLETFLDGIEALKGMTDKVLAYRDRLNDDDIRYAVEKALEHGARSPKYILIVLDETAAKGRGDHRSEYATEDDFY